MSFSIETQPIGPDAATHVTNKFHRGAAELPAGVFPLSPEHEGFVAGMADFERYSWHRVVAKPELHNSHLAVHPDVENRPDFYEGFLGGARAYEALVSTNGYYGPTSERYVRKIANMLGGVVL